MRKASRRLAAAAALFIVTAGAVSAQEEPVTIGTKLKIHSNILKEDRILYVSVPAACQEGGLRCPVLYLLDGNSLFLQAVAATRFLGDRGLAPQMIVVGISAGTTRERDLTPSPSAPNPEAPTAGGADVFRRFLTAELRPYIESRYRTEPYRVLAGWSYGGLFAVHTLVCEPASFDAYIAVSPSLWWDGQAETAAARKLFAAGTPLKKFLYLCHGRENNNIPAAVQAFAVLLGQSAPASLRWKLDYFGTDNHGSIPARAIYNGLESLFSAWAIPEDGVPSVAELERRRTALQAEFNFPGHPGEDRLIGLGYNLLTKRSKPEEAVEMFRYVLGIYPESSEAFDFLAQAYEAAGKLQPALESCREACRIAEASGDSRLEKYRKHLEAVRARLEK